MDTLKVKYDMYYIIAGYSVRVTCYADQTISRYLGCWQNTFDITKLSKKLQRQDTHGMPCMIYPVTMKFSTAISTRLHTKHCAGRQIKYTDFVMRSETIPHAIQSYNRREKNNSS
jgi:hypothetical protein